VGNAVHPPVIRRRTGGPDQAALDALGERRLGDLHRLVPTAAEEAEQLREELAASLAHLQRVDAAYWEREWRREHKGLGVYRRTTGGGPGLTGYEHHRAGRRAGHQPPRHRRQTLGQSAIDDGRADR